MTYELSSTHETNEARTLLFLLDNIKSDSLAIKYCPIEFLKIIHHHKFTLANILDISYLPEILTASYLKIGLETGVIYIHDDQISIAETKVPKWLTIPDTFVTQNPSETNCPTSCNQLSETEILLKYICSKLDFYKKMDMLLVEDYNMLGSDIKKIFDINIMHLSHDSLLNLQHAENDIPSVKGNVFFIDNRVFKLFNLIISPFVNLHWQQRCLSFAFANLQPSGVYYTYLKGNQYTRKDFLTFINRLEKKFYVTDIAEKNGLFIIRSVKLPGLDAQFPLELIRFYAYTESPCKIRIN